MIASGTSCHDLSPGGGNYAGYRPNIHLSQLFRFPEPLLSTHSKLQDTGVHKAMIFSTSGFQSGAIEYASKHGIATIVFVDGKVTYKTLSSEPPTERSWPADLPKYCGIVLRIHGGNPRASVIDRKRLDPLSDWLQRIS